MPKFNANLSMMFNEVTFLERFGAAAKAGFRGVEFLFPLRISGRADQGATRQAQAADGPVQHAARRLRGRRSGHGLRSGESRPVPGKCRQGGRVRQGAWMRTDPLHGRVSSRVESSEETMRATYIANLQFAGKELAKHNMKLLIEAINTRDIPGFYLNYSRQAFDIMHYANVPNLYLPVRHLPHADHGRRSGADGREKPGENRAHAARRHPGASRAGHR